MAHSLYYSDEVQKTAITTGTIGFGSSWWTGYGAIPSTITGTYMGVTGAMETGLTLNDLLDLELRKKAQAEGVEYT